MKRKKHISYINRLVDMTPDELRTACEVHRDCVMNEIINNGNYRQNGILYIPVSIWRNQQENEVKAKTKEYADYFKKDNLSDEEAVGTAIIAVVGEFFKNIQKQYNCIIVPFKVTTKTFHCYSYNQEQIIKEEINE